MDGTQMDRINELARKAKDTGLTEQEKAEQQMLREAYIKDVRENFHNMMNTIVIERPDGTRQKLRKKDDPGDA